MNDPLNPLNPGSILGASQDRKTILSLDDEELVLMSLRIFLKDKGYRHLLATDSHEAYCLLHRERVDLLVQDICRPKVGGFEFYCA